MTCTPSARLEAGFPESNTSYAQEGTYAHAVAETILNWCLAVGFDATPDLDKVREEFGETRSLLYQMLSPLEVKIYNDGFDFPEILATVHEKYVVIVYSEYLAARAKDSEAVLLVEASLKLDQFIPEGFGSSDAVIISDDKLRVFDLKYGRGVKVDAGNNPQMMCYALGAYCGPGEPYLINHVEMTIVQPRLNHVSTWEMPAQLLYAWGQNTLKPLAEMAFAGKGMLTPGDHCRFCKAAPRCKALSRYASASVDCASDASLLNDDELSEVLGRLDTIQSWLTTLQEYALAQALDGRPIPGWKVVEGRSVRKITDQQAALDALTELGWDTDQCYKPRELRTITDLERMVGKKNFPDILGKFVTKAPGKPALVPESDPRPVFSPMNEDFKNC